MLKLQHSISWHHFIYNVNANEEDTVSPLKGARRSYNMEALSGTSLSLPNQSILLLLVCLFVLRFCSPVNPMGSCRARSVYLTTLLLGRLSPLSG